MRFLIWELVVCPLVSIMWLAGVCSPVHTKLHWLQLEMWTLAWLTVIMGQHSNIKLVPANSILSNQTTTANILTAESSEDEQALRNSCELLRKKRTCIQAHETTCQMKTISSRITFWITYMACLQSSYNCLELRLVWIISRTWLWWLEW